MRPVSSDAIAAMSLNVGAVLAVSVVEPSYLPSEARMRAAASAASSRAVHETGPSAAIVEAAAADDVDPLEDLRAGWETQIDFGVANPTLFRLLSDPDRVMHSPAARSGRHVLESRIHRVALTGRLRLSEQRCVDLIQAAGIGTIQALLSTPPKHRDRGLADAMYEAVLGQILTNAPGRSDDGPAATAVAFRAVVPRLDMLSDAERRLMAEWLDRAIEAL